MILNAYSFYDNKALVYHPPFYAPTDGAAIRIAQDLTRDNSTQMGRHPGDFVLYNCGTYNDQSGFLTAISPVRHVVDLNSLLDRQNQLPLEVTRSGE